MENFVPCYYIFENGKRVDFTGLYEISDKLNIKYFNYKGNKGKVVVKNLNSLNQRERYNLITLVKDGIKYNCRVHRLILSSFYPDSEIYECIDHIDGNTHNNSLSNLKFCSISENINNEHRMKQIINGKCSKKVLQFDLNGNLIKEWPSTNEIERQTGYWHNAISLCCSGKHKQSYGYIWKYKKDCQN